MGSAKPLVDEAPEVVAHLPVGIQHLLAAACRRRRIHGRPVDDIDRTGARQLQRRMRELAAEKRLVPA